MKNCLILSVLLCVLINVSVGINNDDAKVQFNDFIATYNKQYSAQEYFTKLEVFKNNLEIVEKLNLQGEAQYAINQFSDLSPADFKNQHLSSLLVDDKPLTSYPNYKPFEFVMNGPLPDSFDWREKGAVTAVKDQASCGSCWAFSTVANIEGQHFLAGFNLTSLSEQQIIECDDTDCGCMGGWPYNAYEYIIKFGGVEPTPVYPYCVPPYGDCYTCQVDKNKTFCGPGPDYCNTTCHSDRTQVAAKISSWTKVSQNETEIAAYLVQRGPLSVLMNAEWLQFYHSGISDPAWCSPEGIDHAVTIVGFGKEGDRLFWIVKNSWGAKWGEQGYFRLARDKGGKCGINTGVTSSLV